eukprot:SAG22_NODE_1590_length_4048_cov_3.816156_2_plen_167_part_00
MCWRPKPREHRASRKTQNTIYSFHTRALHISRWVQSQLLHNNHRGPPPGLQERVRFVNVRQSCLSCLQLCGRDRVIIIQLLRLPSERRKRRKVLLKGRALDRLNGRVLCPRQTDRGRGKWLDRRRLDLVIDLPPELPVNLPLDLPLELFEGSIVEPTSQSYPSGTK